MKITIVSGPWLPVPPLRGGSVPRMWMGLAEQFARRGHGVCMFARRFPGQEGREALNGVAYLRFGGFSQSRWIGIDLLKDFLYAAAALPHLPKGDILVSNSFWIPVLAGYFRTDAGRIVINANRFPKGQYRLYRRAARIVAASQSVRSAIVRQESELSGKVVVIPNTVDDSFLNFRKPSRIPEGIKTLLFVGRIHPEKGVHLLIDAFAGLSARHAGWRLKIVGPTLESQGGGGRRYYERISRMAAGFPIEICEPIFVPALLANEYRRADLFCYPSLAEEGEAFPVAPLEAMASGLPVIASSIECFSEYVRVGESGWIFDHRGGNTTNSLSAVLGEAMRDPARLAAMGEQASVLAQKYGCSEIADQYLREFSNLLENKSASA